MMTVGEALVITSAIKDLIAIGEIDREVKKTVNVTLNWTNNIKLQ